MDNSGEVKVEKDAAHKTDRPGSISSDDKQNRPHTTSIDRRRTQNRRLRYLHLHPEYFSSPHLERVDPLLHDRLIRTFQTPAEREAQRAQRSFATDLEAQLLRSEAKLAAALEANETKPTDDANQTDGALVGVDGVDREDGQAEDRDEAWELWKEILTERFLAGEDAEFDFAELVDCNEGLDDWQEEGRVGLEGWLEKEEEKFVGVGEPVGETGVQDF